MPHTCRSARTYRSLWQLWQVAREYSRICRGHLQRLFGCGSATLLQPSTELKLWPPPLNNPETFLLSQFLNKSIASISRAAICKHFTVCALCSHLENHSELTGEVCRAHDYCATLHRGLEHPWILIGVRRICPGTNSHGYGGAAVLGSDHRGQVLSGILLGPPTTPALGIPAPKAYNTKY